MTTTLTGFAEAARELHEAALHLDPVEYRSWALERIGARVTFDAAWWIVTTAARDAVPHDVVVWHAPAPASQATHAHDADPARGHWYREPAGGQHVRVALAFRRIAGAAIFDAPERELLGLLAAQACAAWRSAERYSLLRHASVPDQVSALADRAGCVHDVLGNFYAALRTSWPEWEGGPLPEPLRAPFRPGAALVIRGQRWNVSDCGGLLRIAAAPLGPVAALTAREKAVAAAVLNAGSQRVAAARLRISANTVRNTLARVYSKLGVRGRVELALRFRHELLRAGEHP